MLSFKNKKYIVVLLPFLAVAETAYAQSSYKDILKLGCDSIAECVVRIIDFAITLAFPVAVIFIVYSGFLFVTAQGAPDKITNAKNTITWTLIGLAIAIGAKALSLAFVEFFSGL
ncbi:MAG: TrbC/VirB2 family protein [bacterium]|nr:TrbC/VirB2 family protein [bacterium]